MRGLKIQIYPNKETKRLFKLYTRYEHRMWNFLVAKFKGISNDILIGKYGIKIKSTGVIYDSVLFAIEFRNKYSESKIVPSRIFRSVLERYCTSWKRCFKKINKAKPPKFHKYNPNKQSFSIIDATWKINNYQVNIPTVKSKKLNQRYMPINHKYVDKFQIDTISNPVISCIRGKWYVSGICKTSQYNSNKIITNEWLGLDWGVKNFYTTSNNITINYPKSINRCYERIKKLTSFKSKKQVNSNNHKKITIKLEKAWKRFSNIKKDFIEQSTAILSNFNVSIEDLTKAKILKSSKNIRRLQLLNPRFMFNTRLEQKCIAKGNHFIQVDPAFTSKICNKCGTVHFNMKLKDRVLNCDGCGLVIDRDLNAAINIGTEGINISSCKGILLTL